MCDIKLFKSSKAKAKPVRGSRGTKVFTICLGRKNIVMQSTDVGFNLFSSIRVTILKAQWETVPLLCNGMIEKVPLKFWHMKQFFY